MDFPKRFSSKEQDQLVRRLLDVYQADPMRLRKALPEVAEILDSSLNEEPLHTGRESPFGLTDRERASRTEALEDILKKSRSLTREEAIRGLEHGAALLIDGLSPRYPSRPDLVRLVRKASGIQPRKEGNRVEKVVGEGEASRSVSVVKGLELQLTWDLRLARIVMDPKLWRLRGQALSFVGIGSDTATDVARRHDDYLADAIQHG